MLVAAGVFYAATCGISEHRFADAMFAHRQGNLAKAFMGVVQANALFPVPYYVREANATMFMMAQWIPPDVAVEQVGWVLKNDPNSGSLLWYEVMARLRLGDMPGAEAALARLRAVGPGWPETENAESVVSETKKFIERNG